MYVKNEYILFSILQQVHFVEKNNRAVCARAQEEHPCSF